MRRRIDGFRAEHGLAPMGCSVHAFFGRLPLYLVHSVADLDYRRRDLPPTVRYVGDCTWRPPDPPGSAEWLDALPQGRPWVHATEGSSLSRDPLVLRAAAEGLGGLLVEVILTTGRLADPHARGLGRLPPNVHAAPWLSHDVLLPRCSAIVTTGGQGTVTAALRSGVPLIVVPAAFDQHGVAERVVASGVGVRLAPRRCTPERLRAAVEDVLGDPRYRGNARRAAELLSAAPGPEGAAELIERLASARRTIGAREASVERATT
jgi:MGT family glycosyltransferase